MRWAILAFLFILFIANFADKSIVGYATVPIMEDLGLSYAQMGIVGSSFYWLFSIAGIVGAAWSDRIGTKKMLAIMALAWTILQFSAFVIYSLPLLILSRVLLGAFEGPYLATAISQLSKWFPPERRGFATAIMNSGGTIGAFLIAPIMVAMITGFGWRVAFAALGLLSLVWFILWIWLGKEQPNNTKKEVSKKAPISRKLKWAEIYPLLLSSTFIFTSLAYFASVSFLVWITTWQPTFMIKVIQLTPAQMGNVAIVIGLGSVVVNALVSLISDQLLKKTQSYRISRVFVTGISLMLAALLLYSITTFQSVWWVVIVFTFAKGLAYTIFVLGPQIVNNLLPERSGLMSGALIGFGNLAGIIVPLITGILVQSAGDNVSLGFNYSLLLIATLILVFGAIFFIFAKPDTKRTKHPIEEAIVG